MNNTAAPTATETPTPRTDGFEITIEGESPILGNRYRAWAEHARQMERELRAANDLADCNADAAKMAEMERDDLRSQLADANDLAKGYAEQNASFAKYISDYSVMSGKYYALALSAVSAAERLTAVMSAPLSDPTSKQAWTVFTDTIQAVRESLADIKPVEMTGGLAMLRERVRQLTVEGWTPEHDKQHKPRELAEAGMCYVIAGHALMTGEKFETLVSPMGAWPWAPTWWKPAYDPLRNLEKGGALLAAAYDRHVAAGKDGK